MCVGIKSLISDEYREFLFEQRVVKLMFVDGERVEGFLELTTSWSGFEVSKNL